MTIERIRNLCLAFPHATEQIQWSDNLVFKVGGKMFAVVGLGDGEKSLAFKCTPGEFALLTERDGVVPAPYLARAHWVRAGFATLGAAELSGRLRQSYDLVFAGLPRKLRESLV